MLKATATVALAALLASCASGPPRTPRAVIDQVLAGSNIATPGKVVAAEFAFARAAREDGQWTAFRAFMAPGALLHGRNGPVDAGSWLARQRDPAEAVEWSPRSIWMSCDGALAVSRGRFLDPEGLVGTFVTVWQRRPDREYRWIYDVGAPDVPQPDAAAEADDGAIVVTAEELIQGYVADCPTAADPLIAPPGWDVAGGAGTGEGASPDGTLQWRWVHGEDGSRSFDARYFVDGGWQSVVNQQFAPASAD